MRLAKLDDLHKALGKRDAKSAPQIMRIQLSNLPGFDDTTLEPKTSFLAICGGTGVGKTALLELLHAALEPQTTGATPERGARIASATIEVTVAVDETSYEAKRVLTHAPTDDHDGYEHGVALVRLETRVGYFDNYLTNSDLDVLKEGIESSLFDGKTIEIISAACRKQYKKIEVFEIEGDRGEFIPFFIVSIEDITYDNRMMATGELSVLYLAWILKTAAPKAIVLIEEPEAHLPPSSHSSVFGLIAQESIRKNICVVITTHSATIAEHVPERCLVSVKSNGVNSSVPRKSESKLRVLSRLGLHPKGNACFFVEDDLAALLLVEVLGSFEFGLVCNAEVVLAGGDGGIKKAIESLPAGIKTVKFIGVLDGDMKNKSLKWKCRDELLFLPFEKAMEVELLKAIESDFAKSALVFGRTENNLEAAFEATRGVDHHDRLREVSSRLKLRDSEFVRGALARWRKKPGNNNKLKKFAIEISKALRVDLP